MSESKSGLGFVVGLWLAGIAMVGIGWGAGAVGAAFVATAFLFVWDEKKP